MLSFYVNERLLALDCFGSDLTAFYWSLNSKMHFLSFSSLNFIINMYEGYQFLRHVNAENTYYLVTKLQFFFCRKNWQINAMTSESCK